MAMTDVTAGPAGEGMEPQDPAGGEGIKPQDPGTAGAEPHDPGKGEGGAPQDPEPGEGDTQEPKVSHKLEADCRRAHDPIMHPYMPGNLGAPRQLVPVHRREGPTHDRHLPRLHPPGYGLKEWS